MTHTVHPYSHRLGITRDWKSRWFSAKSKNYKEFLKSDILLRTYLEKKLRGHFISNIEMERGQNLLRIIIETSRPGQLLGRSGEGAVRLKNDIAGFLKKHKLNRNGEIKLDIKEIRSPESNSAIVAQMIADGLEKRLPFRRVLKQIAEKVMANRDVSGVKLELSGMLTGPSTMARNEKIKRGRLPLQTFRANVDFCKYEARMPYPMGIKVWIYKGEIFTKK